jgi:hypothetical protein
MREGEEMPKAAMRCQIMKNMERLKGLPQAADTCQNETELGRGEGLP